jgi:hypothetical protein
VGRRDSGLGHRIQTAIDKHLTSPRRGDWIAVSVTDRKQREPCLTFRHEMLTTMETGAVAGLHLLQHAPHEP